MNREGFRGGCSLHTSAVVTPAMAVLTSGIPEDLGIAVEDRGDGDDLNAADADDHRRVILSGHRPGETHLAVGLGGVVNSVHDRGPVGDRSEPLADRFPQSMDAPLACRGCCDPSLKRDVINRGTDGGGVRGGVSWPVGGAVWFRCVD
mmetsp:Transcript_18478/g.44490  ORF Transcript_18478/g.44490 Transcript_18478/m.44490 type:complete len:148 (-) Transcript_18478:251-694(-)